MCLPPLCRHLPSNVDAHCMSEVTLTRLIIVCSFELGLFCLDLDNVFKNSNNCHAKFVSLSPTDSCLGSAVFHFLSSDLRAH